MLAPSKRGRHSHSTEPSGASSAPVWQSERKAYSAIGGKGEPPRHCDGLIWEGAVGFFAGGRVVLARDRFAELGFLLPIGQGSLADFCPLGDDGLGQTALGDQECGLFLWLGQAVSTGGSISSAVVSRARAMPMRIRMLRAGRGFQISGQTSLGSFKAASPAVLC